MTITALYRYPVKSCRGMAVDEATITAYGLEYDRCWMVVDAKGRFLSQRRFPAMALIEAEPKGDDLILRAPGMPALMVTQPAGDALAVQVWEHTGAARDAGDGPAAWLSGYLGTACRLVAPDPGFRRPVIADYARVESEVLFADGFPFLLISEASLEDLNTRLTAPVTMDRFRPNIVVGGCEPYAEDGWRIVQLGELIFHIVKPCARCAVPTVDQATGKRGAEPLRTLAGYRRAADGKIYFGQNLVHESKSGILRVGDPVTVLA